MSRLLVENIRHEDASTDALVLDNAGNISIPGTLSTGSRVGVNQTPAANNFALQVTGVTNNGTDGRAVLIKGSNASTTIGGAGPNLAIQNTDSTANNVTKLSFETASAGEAVSINSINTNHSSFYGDLAINTRGAGGYSEKMRVMADGNVGIGTTAPFAKSHVKDTGWSSGSPYGTVALVEGNNVNDNNWGHLVITDTTTANGNGGSIRFATGASSALNPFSGIQGTAEGTSWGGIGFDTRPQSGTATRRLTIDSIGTVGIGTSDLDNWSAVFDGRVRLGATGFVGTTSASTQLGNNWRYNGSAYQRLTNDYALRYYQNGGDHVWETAVSDAADSSITWSTKMQLQETGYLDLTSDSQIRLSLGNVGTPGTNTANWIRGTGGQLGLNAASDNIHFEIGGTQMMKINPGGYVTTPYIPAFSWLGSRSHSITTTGTQTMTSGNVWSSSVNHAFNNGSHFNASNGRFTAPIAGKYHFEFQCMASNFGSGYLWFYMDINGSTKSYMQMNQQTNRVPMVHHMNCELAVGDYVTCTWTNNYVSGQIHYPGFSGHLIG